MRVIGLTGGIGSGKTTVAGFFKELGVPVYIADEAGKKILNTSQKVRSKIIALLGEQSYNGSNPDRKFIASKVFENKEMLDELNKIIHPEVELDFEKWKSNQQAPYVIYEAAILFESGGYKKCDKVILITAPKSIRISRLQKRDESTLEEIEARMQHQWADVDKKKLSHFEIINTNIAFTREQVINLHEILLKAGKN